MLTPEELAECRATHETIFTDVIRLYHSGQVDEEPFDPALGYEPSSRPEPYYGPGIEPHNGKGIVQARAIQTGNREVVEQTVSTLGYAVKVPVTVTGAALADLVEVVESSDPRNVGLWLVVQGEESNTLATARRLSCTRFQAAEPA